MSGNNYHVLIQAREGSQRLPNKVILPVYEESLIESILFRFNAKDCSVLTGSKQSNLQLSRMVQSAGYPIQFGDDQNVMSRYANYAQNSSVDYLIRVTGDNPFVQHQHIQPMIELMQADNLDYCINSEIPIGCALEVIRRISLLKLCSGEIDQYSAEHVTPAFYTEASTWRWAKFRAGFNQLASLRLTVDTNEDLQLVRNLCQYFAKPSRDISLQDIDQLYSKDPDFFSLNRSICQRSYRELE